MHLKKLIGTTNEATSNFAVSCSITLLGTPTISSILSEVIVSVIKITVSTFEANDEYKICYALKSVLHQPLFVASSGSET